MTIDGLDDVAITAILTAKRRIAMVGASANAQRPSYGVLTYLLARGYDVTPVNPGLTGDELQGVTVVGSLDEATPLDMVDIFRASDQVPEVVDDAIRLGAKIIWMQLGVINQEAAAKARAAGITVVMDRCPVIEAMRLNLPDPA